MAKQCAQLYVRSVASGISTEGLFQILSFRKTRHTGFDMSLKLFTAIKGVPGTDIDANGHSGTKELIKNNYNQSVLKVPRSTIDIHMYRLNTIILPTINVQAENIRWLRRISIINMRDTVFPNGKLTICMYVCM